MATKATASGGKATATSPSRSVYDIDYEDERFQNVESAKDEALTQMEQTYGGMIADTDKYYQDLKDSTQAWADKQTQLQQDQTNFTIETIEQQKDQAHQDYVKEQSGAYVDWRKQSNQYGTEAEKMASAGLTGTGFSESSQVSMYNTYQNRVATARESYNRAVLNYDNSIKEAMLQNNAVLAEIAFEALQKQLELSLEGFQYKNQLIIEQANKKIELDDMYYNRYQDVLQQINTENAMQEEIRQFNESQRWEAEQKQLDRDWQTNENKLDRQFEEKQNQIKMDFQAKEAELDRKHAIELENVRDKHEKEQLKIKHEQEKERLAIQQKNALEQLAKEHANDKALLAYQHSLEKQNSTKQNSTKITGSGTSNSYNSKPIAQSVSQQKSNLGVSTGHRFNGTTAESAHTYLTRYYGLPSFIASAAMTPDEWSRRRTSYMMTDQGGREVTLFDNYADYIQDYANFHAKQLKKG